MHLDGVLIAIGFGSAPLAEIGMQPGLEYARGSQTCMRIALD